MSASNPLDTAIGVHLGRRAGFCVHYHRSEVNQGPEKGLVMWVRRGQFFGEPRLIAYSTSELRENLTYMEQAGISFSYVFPTTGTPFPPNSKAVQP